jgi:hypothetical protein
MPTITRPEKFRFWIKWISRHIWIIPVSYIASLVVLLVLSAIFGISLDEFGTPAEQLIMQLAGSSVIGVIVGFSQTFLLKGIFPVQRIWVWATVMGFFLAEAIAGIICWQIGVNRMQLRFIESNYLPESLIFASAGLLIGLLQWFQLRKHFCGSIIWILGSTVGWGAVIFVMGYSVLFPALQVNAISILIDIIVFMAGSALYGALTGAALMWGLQMKTARHWLDPSNHE